MRNRSLLIVLAAAPLLMQAQTTTDPTPIVAPTYALLVKYLDLKADQVTALTRLELQYQHYIATKQSRVAEVNKEIRQLTLAQTVDAAGLGVRYAELEAICREARDTGQQTSANARKLMTTDQLAELTTLEQAYALVPVIVQADSIHLISASLPTGSTTLATNAAAEARSYPGCKFPNAGQVAASAIGQ